jgi:hypothetical protein
MLQPPFSRSYGTTICHETYTFQAKHQVSTPRQSCGHMDRVIWKPCGDQGFKIHSKMSACQRVIKGVTYDVWYDQGLGLSPDPFPPPPLH